MMHSIKSRGFFLGSALLVLSSIGYTSKVQASPSFPVQLQKALDARFPGTSYCVPLCTACHTVTTGGPGNYNPFGLNLLKNGLASDSTLPAALNKLLDQNLDSDGDGRTDNEELKTFDEPGGKGAFCTDLQYGCGARIAPAPPPADKVGLFSAGLVMLGLALLRRRRG
jgi:MYXO-CTERM domain-containing protein